MMFDIGESESSVYGDALTEQGLDFSRSMAESPRVTNVNKYNNEVSKEDEQAREIARLKEFLIQLDQEIEEEGRKYNSELVALRKELAARDETIIELQSRQQNFHEVDIIETLENENGQLKELIAKQSTELEEAVLKSENLQSALLLLQQKIQEEVDLGLAEARQSISALESDLVRANEKISSLETEIKLAKKGGDCDELVGKLIKDLDARNFLIDELNDEINCLKKKLVQCANDNSRDGYIQKEVLRQLLIRLSGTAGGEVGERNAIWTKIAELLRFSENELRMLGLRVVNDANNYASNDEDRLSKSGTIQQGLSDVWISFLLNQTLPQPQPNTSHE